MRLAFPHKVLGIVFLCLLLLSVWLTYAVFTKKFSDYDEVTLQTSKIGLQLPDRADIKVRGVIVGEVLESEATNEGAELTLGIYPGEIDNIPADVTGSIIPKTLFGEKFVALEIPEGSTASNASALAVGDTVLRTEVSIEVEEVLADLYPLLRTVQPAELNMTLNAVATALEGNGEQLGANLETLDSYLKRLNPQIPLIVDDLRLTAQVSDTYADVMPEIAEILRNTVTTGNTLQGREDRLRELFVNVSAFSDTTTDFLADNGDNIIRLGHLSASQTAVFAKYAPEYPCLLNGVYNAGKRQAEAFRGFTLHINLETLPNQPRSYTPADRPRNGDKRGPNCETVPNPAWTQSHPWQDTPDIDDGVDSPTGKGTQRVAPGFADGYGYAGSAQESSILKSMLGPALGQPADHVEDLAVLLVAPLARGAEVSLR